MSAASRRSVAFYALLIPTVLSLCLLTALLGSDAEARLWGAALGGGGLTFLAPFSMLYRGRLPLLQCALLLVVLVGGVVLANCWAARMAGTVYTHPSDYVGYWLNPVPGVIYVAARVGRRREDGGVAGSGGP